MKKLLIVRLIIIVALGDVAKSGVYAFKWKSSSVFPNGTVVKAYVGDNVTFPWEFVMKSPKEVVIEWTKTSENNPDQEKVEILAKYRRNTFYGLSRERDVEFLPNAGINLPNVTMADKGVYTVEINLFGRRKSHKQVAFLQVSERRPTSCVDVQKYDKVSGVHTLFVNNNIPIKVYCDQQTDNGGWTTPSREILNSTSYDNGVFILTVSNPVEDGEYSCFLEIISPAVVCLHNQSSMNRAATVDVKGVHTRISLLEGGLEALREETVNLTVPVSELEDLVHKLETSNKIFEEKMDILQDSIFNITTENKQLRQEVQRLESVDRNITTENKQLRQEVQRLENVNRNITDLMLENIRQINDVKGDVRKLQSDKDNLEAIVFDLKDQFGLSRIQRKDRAEKPSSCEDVKNYDNSSGIHTLFLGDSSILNIYCDQSTDNGGWMVIQRRQDGSVKFYRDWNQYEVGFGNMSTEFWIGLDNLHQLTKSKTVKLHVDLMAFDGSTAYAVYNTFNISGADDNYRLNVGGYSGTAGDSLARHNKMQFSTFDRDHDTSSDNCAQDRHGAWWYKDCTDSNLNGRYKSDGASGYDGVNWLTWKYDQRSLKRVEMKIKE